MRDAISKCQRSRAREESREAARMATNGNVSRAREALTSGYRSRSEQRDRSCKRALRRAFGHSSSQRVSHDIGKPQKPSIRAAQLSGLTGGRA